MKYNRAQSNILKSQQKSSLKPLDGSPPKKGTSPALIKAKVQSKFLLPSINNLNKMQSLGEYQNHMDENTLLD